MGAHFEVLKQIFQAADEDIRGIMFYTFDVVLEPNVVDLEGIERDDSDDVLTALQKRKARRAAYSGQQRPRTLERMEASFYRHVFNGASEAFLVTAFLDVVDSDLAMFAQDNTEEFLANNTEVIDMLDRQIAQAHEENKPRLEELKASLVNARDDYPGTMRTNVDRYRRWRAIAGNRLGEKRVTGGWEDCVREDMKDSEWLKDIQ